MTTPVEDRESGPPALEREPRLERILENVGRLLPAQGPISVFVHHNTLHAFEHLPFEQAVVEAGALFGCEPFLLESRYRDELHRLRILEHDLDDVVREDLGPRASDRPGRRTTRAGIRLTMLKHRIHEDTGPSLTWLLAETDARTRFREDTPHDARRRLLYWARTHGRRTGRGAERFALDALWRACLARTGEGRPVAAPRPPLRLRDLMLRATGEDSDLLVHPALIRFCAAFLDQGIALWPVPDREAGFFTCFARLHGERNPFAPSWMSGLGEELAREADSAHDPIASVGRSLELLGVAESEWEDFIAATLLALKGWAGMVHQFETRPDRVPVHSLPATLAEYLAVRLLLERLALAHLGRKFLGHHGPLAALTARLRLHAAAPDPGSSEERAWLLFQLSQVLGRTPDDIARLTPEAAHRVLDEMESFPELERRRVFHLAYERRHRVELLDAITVVADEPVRQRPGVSFQAVFCIDEREESLRRHVEEIEPGCETFGAAGFFGVAMYYRGASDAHSVPLCPIVILPEHEVREEIEDAFQREERRKAGARRFLAWLAHEARVGSRTLTRGTLLTALLGALSAVPLVFRVLFPRLTGRLRRTSGKWLRTPAATRLTLERVDERTPERGNWTGFTIDEMAAIVRRLLEDTGLAGNLAPVVVVVGHGSSSLNNPHESAHDCGACGGGRGGPNARAFATMANHPDVRVRLATQGCPIPDDTLFVGMYHDTCDDDIVLFDTRSIPEDRRSGIERIAKVFERARTLNAHERCRRFDSAPQWLPPNLALAHVEGRANDLAQVRPEYGHATNAACFVGRRSRIRGLFLDRRAFLVSYDPGCDDADGTILARLLASVVPVCAGISLEYYFCHVDPAGYGCGTKLPHNITSLLGVMDGSASDLRTGLPWQMVEIHEPVRLLVVVEAPTELLTSVVQANETLARLVRNRWIRLATLTPSGSEIHVFGPHGFVPYEPESNDLPVVSASQEWYGGDGEHLAPAHVVPAGVNGS